MDSYLMWLQIGLVSDQQHTRLRAILHRLRHPAIDTIERLLVRHVVYKDNSVGVAIEGGVHRPETILAGL